MRWLRIRGGVQSRLQTRVGQPSRPVAPTRHGYLNPFQIASSLVRSRFTFSYQANCLSICIMYAKYANVRIISARYPDGLSIGYHEQGTAFVPWAVSASSARS